MIKEWIIHEPRGPVRNCIVALAGRSNSAEMMLHIGNGLHLPDTLVVAMRPHGFAWYPQPFAADDQDDAVAGLPEAVQAVEKRLRAIRSGWRLKNKRICILGFSAGSVIGLQLALATKNPFLAVVSFAGAILQPEQVPPNDGRGTHFILQHNQDDICFDWHERYLPMRDSLIGQGYNVWTLEKPWGHHQVLARDIVSVSNHLGPLLGYRKWQHEESERFDAIPLTNRTHKDDLSDLELTGSPE